MQTALTYRTNRDLFSNHYLDEHLPETEEWDEVSDEELQEAYDDIMALWEREKDTAPKRNESQLEEKFIRPMFRKLGIPFEVEESTSRTQRRPDYGFLTRRMLRVMRLNVARRAATSTRTPSQSPTPSAGGVRWTRVAAANTSATSRTQATRFTSTCKRRRPAGLS